MSDDVHHAAGVDDALLPLATRAADDGDYERVSTLFARASAQPLPVATARRWYALLTEAGDFTAAAEAARLAGIERPLVAPSAPVEPESNEGEVLDFDPGPREAATPAIAADLLVTFLRWFGGRADVYARQWYDARRDRSGYWPIREPFTARVVEEHLLGRLTLGQYVLHPDNSAGFAVLDLDPTAEAAEQVRLEPQGEGGLAVPALTDYAQRLRQTADRAGLAAALEDTGGLGLHLWLFFNPRLPAERARALLRELLWRAGPQPPAIAVELFPKQDRLTGKGLGNLVKLPFGVHQVTGRPSCFLDANLQPLPAEAALGSLSASDPAAIEALLANRVVPLVRPLAPDRSEPPPQPPTCSSPRGLAEALAAIPAGRAAETAADRILAACAVVRELARRAHEEHTLSPDGARALLYTVGLVGRENERIEALFAQAGVSRKELDRVRRGLQGPMGCKRLRERFPDLCAGCTCPQPAGGYVTPALHALHAPVTHTRRPAPWPEPPALPDSVDAVAPTEIDQRLRRIEAALEQLLVARREAERE